MAAGNIEHVFRLAQAGNPSAQRRHQRLAPLQRGAQMRGAGREIAVMQVIGLYAAFDENAHQGFERCGVIIDATQQHGLADQGNAGIGETGAGRACAFRKFARMVGMHRDPGRGALHPRCSHHFRTDTRGIGNGDTGVDADDLDVIDGGKISHDFGKPSRRQHQGIAAGQDHFPDFIVGPDIVERGLISVLGKRGGFARSDHFAAEAEAAIDRADMHELEQHAVGITMHDAGDRRMCVVADWIGALAWCSHQLLRARNELPRDGIGGIIGIDQRGNVGRHRNRIARGDLLQHGKIVRTRKSARHQLIGPAQGRGKSCCKFWVDPVHALLHVTSAGGVHTTWSIRSAPLASITSRSKPSATPLASGILPTAAKNSSSSG